MIRKTLFLILACTAGLAAAAAPDKAPETAPAKTPGKASVEVVGAEFGTFDDGAPGELVFTPSDTIPHRTGQRYGWVIEVRTGRRSLAVSEEYLLPGAKQAATATDPVSESLSLPAQRRSQVSQRQLVPVDGKIYGEWAIGPNEPAGHRHLQVLIEGQPVASFEYDVK